MMVRLSVATIVFPLLLQVVSLVVLYMDMNEWMDGQARTSGIHGASCSR